MFTPPLRDIGDHLLLDPDYDAAAADDLYGEATLGHAAIHFAEQIVGISLYPWQRWLLVHALELLPDGLPRFRTVIVLVARQNGKTCLSVVLSLFYMYVLGRPLVIGTAQDLDVAEETWQDAIDLVEETPELLEMLEHVSKVNGKKYFKLTTGERYKVKAANRRAGRGLSGDLVLFDELREHQSWNAWAAVSKTTLARAAAQVWALSNAGDVTSLVLRYLRKVAHRELGDPDGVNANDDPTSLLPEVDGFDGDEDDVSVEAGSLGLFEWSAPPACAVGDRDGWVWANPSLGYGITERAIASCLHEPEWVFRTEVLCQWSDGSLEGPFPPGMWEACADPPDEITGELGSKVAVGSPVGVCVDVAHDRSKAYVAVAGRRADGRLHVEVVASGAGTDWVLGWLTDDRRDPAVKVAKVALQSTGAPVSTLLDELVKESGEERVVEWKGADLGRACGDFYDLVVEGGVRHLSQPVLDVPAATAVSRPTSDAWVWDRKNSPTDIAPLVAVTGAAWLMAPKPVEEQKRPQIHPWDDDDGVEGDGEVE